MVSRTLVLAALAAIGPASLLLAQDRPFPAVPQSLSLQEAIDLANQYSPVYRQTENNRPPAAWGVRNALASMFLPNLSVRGVVAYSGPGSQNLLTTSFVQPSGTIFSQYSLGLNWSFSGQMLSQLGFKRAQLAAADADITGERMALRAAVVGQYLTVLEKQDDARLTEAQQQRADEALRLAQALYQVGQKALLDVRQAEVQKGQADVAVFTAQQAVTVEKLRLFQQMGVPAPEDPAVVTLSDTLPVVEPSWTLRDLLTEAEAHNADLHALKARHNAAVWNERAVKSEWLPTFALSAGWSGYTQHFTDLRPVVANALVNAQQSAQAQADQCSYTNANLVNPGATPLTCPSTTLSAADSTSIAEGLRTQYPTVGLLDFGRYSKQPFSASVSVSFPIFTQFGRPQRASQAAADADNAYEMVRERTLNVRTDVTAAYYDVQTAYRTIAMQQTNQTAAQGALHLATEKYRVDGGTFSEVLAAQATAQQAERDYVEAIYAYHRAILVLETAVGRPLR
jgi:outer membrane protein TolC